MISTYNSILTQTLDALAPVKTKTIKTMQVQPWFSATIKKKIRICRMKEWKWRSDPNEYNYMAFYYQRRHVANIIHTAQNRHYSSILAEHKNNPKEIF